MLLNRLGAPKQAPPARLESVGSAAHRGHRWPLLPSGPDGVRDSRLRGNWPSPGHEEAMRRFGGDDRDRTGDLLVANEALSQLSYIPTDIRIMTLHNWRREWDSNPRSTFMLTRFPTVLLQPLGHLSGKLRSCALPTRLHSGWRRERDSNPRYPYGYSGFRDRPIQPLSHLSAGENTRIRRPGLPSKVFLSLDFATIWEYHSHWFPTHQEGSGMGIPLRLVVFRISPTLAMSAAAP